MNVPPSFLLIEWQQSRVRTMTTSEKRDNISQGLDVIQLMKERGKKSMNLKRKGDIRYKEVKAIEMILSVSFTN